MNLAVALTGDRSLAEELAQEGFTAAFREFELPDGSIAFGNPYDDLSGDPRPEDGLVVLITVD